MNDNKKLEAIESTLKEVSEIVSTLEPEIRVSAFKILYPILLKIISEEKESES